jgi:hypothetical protein
MKDWKEINVFKILIVITLLALVLSICTGCGEAKLELGML